MAEPVDVRRVRALRDKAPADGPVVYWLDRDQRAHDNWALLYAQELALAARVPLSVVFLPDWHLRNSSSRQHLFALTALQQTARVLTEHNISFSFVAGSPEKELPRYLERSRAAALVTDFSPLRVSRRVHNRLARLLTVPFYEVDAHNVVPCWMASAKLEYAAYTFRPKLNRLLSEFLVPFPALAKHPFVGKESAFAAVRPPLTPTHPPGTLPAVKIFKPGEREAAAHLDRFLEDRLVEYHTARNDPAQNGQSQLSPYLHFGHLSAQRVALEVQRHDEHIKSQESFLEELLVRRELADNFCFYNADYDAFRGFPEWARKSLDEHRLDPRPFIYSEERLEQAATDDPLWNAAQMEMRLTGKMHGYMRMYWAKKILEWSPSPEAAMNIAVRLNDRYELDGHDPNGYTGISWSIGGAHDRPWFERPVFGKVRYMSYNGCRRKFDIQRYIAGVRQLRLEATP
ncbi:MAG: deoxyribodipyrimidine photo-lyase [candidate division Zixibacteria bacterium]|nr:deoxyribodipyrimidine photo-lyase [candidate division Zixibacteria bacterium]